MVQVDVFWSYGIGAGFALAAANQLRAAASRNAGSGGAGSRGAGGAGSGGGAGSRAGSGGGGSDGGGVGGAGRGRGADPFLAATVIYAAAVFGPSGAWLLWQFTSWETMHAGSYDTVPGWLVALFTVTNTTQAILGFVVTRWLLERDRMRLACLQLVAGYFAMFFVLVHGWDGTGYQRFFSATAADFRAWDRARLGDWFTSDVALTLYAMGAVLVPILLGMCWRWQAAARGGPAAWRFVGLFLAAAFGLGLGGAVVASVLIHVLGWAGGVAAFTLVAAAIVGTGRGPVGWAATRIAASPPAPPVPEPDFRGTRA